MPQIKIIKSDIQKARMTSLLLLRSGGERIG